MMGRSCWYADCDDDAVNAYDVVVMPLLTSKTNTMTMVMARVVVMAMEQSSDIDDNHR